MQIFELIRLFGLGCALTHESEGGVQDPLELEGLEFWAVSVMTQNLWHLAGK